MIGHGDRNLAGILVKQEECVKGYHLPRRLTDANPKDIKTLHVYINCLLDFGKSDKSFEVCKEALKTYPDDKLVNVSQASSLRSQMKNDQALEKIDEVDCSEWEMNQS